MRISDWSSDVCSSDLGCANALEPARPGKTQDHAEGGGQHHQPEEARVQAVILQPPRSRQRLDPGDQRPGEQVRQASQADADREDHHQVAHRSEEHTSELQSLMRISYAVFCLKKKTQKHDTTTQHTTIK